MRAVPVPQTQAAYVYDAIKGDILSGKLRGGEAILQAEWAERMGTSVTPVREAIRRLGQDGLVENAPHRGTRVVTISLQALEDIYEMRMLVEPLQLRRSYHKLSTTQAVRARELCDLMNGLTEEQTAEFIDLNIEFHNILLAHDGSWTSRVVQMLQAAASPYVSLSIAEEPAQLINSNQDHYGMLDAVIDEDIDLAVEILQKHLASTHVLAKKYLLALEGN